MALIMVPYAARPETPFPECARLVAADERGDVIALAWHEGYLADTGRAVYAGHRRHGLGIYDARSRALLARFRAHWEINRVAVHPTRDEVAIATGEYDGGYQFEGQLLIWNWRTGAWHSELTENREVKLVEWRGDELVATLSPPTDEDPQGDLVYVLAPARAGERNGWGPGDSQVEADARLAPALGRPAPGPAPDATFARYDELVDRHAHVTAIDWLADGRVAIGTGDGSLLLWEPATQRTQELRVESRVTGMWRHPDHELLVHVETHQTTSSLFAIVGDRLELVKHFPVPHACSVDRHGRILARSTVPAKRRKSTILDGKRTLELALGHFDVFNHFIRLDGGDELYFLQGEPPRSHQHKKLCAITARGDVEIRMPWDDEAHHKMSSIGALVGDGRIARGYLVHNPRGTQDGAIELCDLTGRSFWRHEIRGGITAMAIWQGCVVAALLDGTFLALELDTGKVMHDEPFLFGSSPAMVTAIAVHDEAIALGSIDGRVSIVTSR